MILSVLLYSLYIALGLWSVGGLMIGTCHAVREQQYTEENDFFYNKCNNKQRFFLMLLFGPLFWIIGSIVCVIDFIIKCGIKYFNMLGG